MADTEKVITNLELVKASIEWDSPLDYQVMIVEAIQTIRELQGKSEDVCEWKLFDEEANAYDTSCGGAFCFNDGNPKDNGFKYCPYCKKEIKVVE